MQSVHNELLSVRIILWKPYSQCYNHSLHEKDSRFSPSFVQKSFSASKAKVYVLIVKVKTVHFIIYYAFLIGHVKFYYYLVSVWGKITLKF